MCTRYRKIFLLRCYSKNYTLYFILFFWIVKKKDFSEKRSTISYAFDVLQMVIVFQLRYSILKIALVYPISLFDFEGLKANRIVYSIKKTNNVYTETNATLLCSLRVGEQSNPSCTHSCVLTIIFDTLYLIVRLNFTGFDRSFQNIN